MLVLTGGPPHAHDFADSGGALAELVAATGRAVELVDHPDDAAERLDQGGVDALVVNALRWRMHGEAYDAWRDGWAYETSPHTRDHLAGFVRRGGGLLANHTASICFDDWPEWGDVVGGSWRWGVSSHPPCGPVSARVVAEHPVVAGLPSTIELVDEVYGDQHVRPDVTVLAVARRHADDAEQPVVWVHRYGRGRVVYDGFGHDGASIRHPDNSRLLRQGLDWILEDDT